MKKGRKPLEIAVFTVHLVQKHMKILVQSDKITKKHRKLWKFTKICSIIVITLLINYLNIY